MSESANFLAVDLGASNGRVMRLDWDGARFALAEAHRFPNGGVRRGAHIYWDSHAIWSQIQTGIAALTAQVREPSSGIGVDAWGVDYALLDSSGNLIADPHHYRDRRTEGIVEKIHDTVKDADLFRATGVQTMAINTAYQLASAMVAGGDGLQGADCLLMIPDLFQYFLAREKRVEYTEATTTQLFDITKRSWSDWAIGGFGIPRRIFPKVALPGSILGPTLPSSAAACGLSDCPPCIAVASHDTASAVAAIPAMDEGSVFLSSGTWSLMGVHSDRPDLSPEAYRLGFTNEGSANGGVLLLKNLPGLWILQECQRCWNHAEEAGSWAAIARAAEDAPAFRSLIDPLAPEFQAPDCMLDAVRQFCSASGQPLPGTLGEFARCALESLCLLYRRTQEDLRRLSGRSLTTIRVVGGGAQNRLLCQMTADACGLEVIAGPVEAAALGNAMVQAIATGHLADFSDGSVALTNSVRTVHYKAARDDRWQECSGRIEMLSDRVRSTRLRSAVDSHTVLSR